MKRKNTTRSALLTSIISLLLCVSMLVGTTFAWFTDEVKSGTNLIAAGNLDVEVYNGLDAKAPKVTTDTKLFDEITYWEPGVVAYENLTVANLGSLALKYQLAVNFTDATTNAKGQTLAKVLKVGFVKGGISGYSNDAAGRTALVNELNEDDAWQSLESFVQSGDLLKGENDVYGIVIYWQPSNIDNDFNMNNGQTTTMKIDLGIKLFATQLEAEKDSFDETYDEDAWHPDMFVTTAAELAKAIEEVKDGGIIALAADLTFNEESRMFNSGTYYDGLYYHGDKSFTIDLNGKTITNDSAVNDYLLNFKNSGAKPNTITIKNGTIEAASSAYCAIATASSNAQKITINLENVNLIGNNSNGAVAKIRGGAELNVKAGTVITGKNSYVGIEATGNDTVVNFYDDAEIYQNGTGSYVGSLIGVSNNATANVYGGYGKSAQGAFIAMTSGGTINVHGGEWIANNDGTYANSNRSALIAQSARGAKSTINVTGGTFKGGYNCYGDAVGDAQINISAGIFNADPSAHVADGYQAIDNGNGTYVVVSDNIDEVIMNAADLLALGGQKLEGTYALMADIDLGGAAMPTIGAAYGKELTIIGNGHTISNATTAHTVHNGMKHHGFFYAYTNSTLSISDLTFENIVIDATKDTERNYGAAIVVAFADGGSTVNLDNVDVKNSKVLNNKADFGDEAGVYVGYQTGTLNMVDCDAIGCEVAGETAQKTGAFIGMVNGTATLTNCTTDLSIGACNRVAGTLVFDGNTFVSDGLYKGAAGDYYVYNANGLAKINEMFKNYSLEAGVVIELMSDIDFTGKTWIQVDSHQDWKTYLKELNGNNHTISNFTIEGQAMFRRFSGIGTVTIKDLTFDNATVNANGINASILTAQAYQDVLLDNVDVKNSHITGNYKVAPLIGSVYDEKETTVTATVKNCDVSKTTVTATQYDFYTTGLVAFVYAGDNDQIAFENCTVTDVTLIAPDTYGYTYHAAVYCDDNANLYNEVEGVTVTNCTFRNS